MFNLLFLLLTNGLLLNVMAETTRVEQVLNACGPGKIQHSTRQERLSTFDDLRVSVSTPQTEQGCCVLTNCEKARKVYTSKRNCVLRARKDGCKR